ncbi:MAG: peptidoglycan bridge formation glycyltransferase FemA/FemB family protein [Candidatus Beckwithbacteria bacterium]|nr:aminoacyltransferase [Patescibacteria group bacterium]
MITAKKIEKKSVWENFLQSSDQVNFLQSWNWGVFHLNLGHSITRLGFYKSKKLIGLALLINIKAKRGSYLECPGGPIISYYDQETIKQAFDLIKKLGVKEQVSFIRVRPNVIETKENLSLLKKLGLIKSPMHLHAETTRVLDLDRSKEELLSQMRKNTRYAIKKSEKLKVLVTTSVNPKDIDFLHQLQLDTVKRHHFVPFTKDYFLCQLNAFKQDNQIQLFKASYQDQVLAISFIIFYGPEAIYHYSGSSSQHREIPASYALQWAAIKATKKRGLKRYNFWGITKDNKQDHRFSGITLFKKGFGGRQVNYIRGHDLPLKPTYWLTFIFETLRRRIRHL